MDRATITAETKALLAAHGLNDYRVRISERMTRTYGTCNFGKREITISGPLARANDEARTRDTIAHEVAHAIAGYKAGHGPDWKAACALTGATPKACYEAADTALVGRFQAVCEGCAATVAARTRWTPKMNQALRHKPSKCTVKGGGRLRWHDTEAASAPTAAPRPVAVAAKAPTKAPVVTATDVARETRRCQGACNAVRPLTKFPTVSGKPGERGAECRDCAKARRAAKA